MRPFRILIVEDNPGDVLLLREVLRDWNTKVEIGVVQTGDEALPYLRQQSRFADAPRPDLVLLDINLPKRNGHDILKEIKSDEVLKAIPVVIFSSSTSSRDVDKSYALHANSYICKPQNLEDYFGVLKSLEAFWFRTATLPRRVQ